MTSFELENSPPPDLGNLLFDKAFLIAIWSNDVIRFNDSIFIIHSRGFECGS